MPELPEVQTVVSELNRKLKNKTIKSVSVLRAKMVGVGPDTLSPLRKASPAVAHEFIRKLSGQKIKSVKRRAKLLIFDFSPTPSSSPPRAGGEKIKMLVHLKMTGQFIYFRKSELNKRVRIINKPMAPLHSMPCPYTHVIFTFTDGSRLFYNDVRQFGYLKLVRDDEIERVKELKEFGPEPLDKKFTLSVFSTAVKKAGNRKAPIKTLLMDVKFIAGIGNIYSDEILFRAGISPSRRVKILKPAEIRAVYLAILFILKKGIAAHGSSVGDFIRTDGSFGSMGKYHFVYGRSGQKCKVCGIIIKTAKFGGRTGSFCPRCQK